MTFTIEAVTMIVGFHLFHIFQISIINDMYIPVNIRSPKWIKYILNIIEFVFICLVLIFYMLLYLSHNIYWTHAFYIVLSVIVFLHSLCILFVLKRLLNILCNVNIDLKAGKLETA
eukprot:UN11407